MQQSPYFAAKPPGQVSAVPGLRPGQQPIAPAGVRSVLRSEIRSLGAPLASQREISVYRFEGERCPGLVAELGRVRELTFREEGEGTGCSRDLDRYDRNYTHLVAWNDMDEELVGAYRIGATDMIGDSLSGGGLYTESLFRFEPEFFRTLGPSLELGRSFVRPGYQRSFAPLLLLWRGIGALIAEQPRYRYLFGPVTISNRYREMSQAVLAAYLSTPSAQSSLARHVRPRRGAGFALDAAAEQCQALGRSCTGILELDRLVASLEPDGIGVPTLLRQYWKLGACGLGLNRDTAFGNCLDVLCLVDLQQTPVRTLEKYMGPQGAARFLAHHRKNTAAAPCSS